MWDLWDLHLWPGLLREACCARRPRWRQRGQLRAGAATLGPAACCCVPLRSAVFVSALGSTLLSLLLLGSREFAERQLRVCSGGYALQSRVIVDLIELSAVVWGAIGAVGAVTLRPGPVRIFYCYQVLRVLAWLAMYLTDVPLLWNCELWKSNVREAAAQYGWNEVMYTIAMNNRCRRERQLFVVLSTLSLLGFLYLTWVTQWFLRGLEQEPRYLLQLPQDRPGGAFYTKSLAGRSHAPPGGPGTQGPVPPGLA